MNYHKLLFVLALTWSGFGLQVIAQGQFSGDLQLETQFYDRDEEIGASGTPHYDFLKRGGDSWLSLNYLNIDWDLTIGVRFDGFYNSNLHNPGTDFTGVGIGRFYIQKKVEKLDITAGNFYEQYGSGLIFRTFEERSLGIDQSMFGMNLKYELGDNWMISGMGGQLKRNQFGTYAPIIFGSRLEGTVSIGENLIWSPGAAVISRTLDKESMASLRNTLQQQINALDPASTDTLIPAQNNYAFTLYNSLDFKNFSWYGEAAYKTHEYIPIDTAIGENVSLFDTAGYAIYSSLTYSKKGIGITGQYRRIRSFDLRTSINESFLNGVYSYLPTLTRQNSFRLPARYNSVARSQGEQTFEIDIIYSPVKGYTISLNASDVKDLNGLELFREFYADIEIRKSRKWKLLVGGQYVQYNQEIYEAKPGVKPVKTINPFTEFLYKFDKRKSIRFEAQMLNMLNEADFGSWVYGLVEFNMAPSLSVSLQDMYNYSPTDKSPGQVHYYTVYASYKRKANRFYLSYSKQVEGIVCTGGVCRFEPAFSGVKFGLSSSF
ncbi:MAG: hypothetical protein ACI959_001108 [Limisphaerales bacterium]|jgi:hypothetical protein